MEIQGKCSNAGSFVLSSYKNNTLCILKHRGNQKSIVICKRFPSYSNVLLLLLLFKFIYFCIFNFERNTTNISDE